MMEKPTYHILVCNSFRVGGDPRGVCNRKDALDLLQMFENEVIDRGIDALVSSTGCLKQCEKGPVVVVYPGGWWYPEVDPDKVDQILDALESGQPAAELLAA
ncbi:MAG: (2Fe-2S) ferredoxin domain-containing protein [Pirellulaceae bacterium]|nr:(2Fe-2S) ferredoxin domain-containing protein [Pirellulaceae bacterium]